tara:strand:- start:2076 stop:3173 length:1098 start_codon:yes stop_codon:yes gene_type:complete
MKSAALAILAACTLPLAACDTNQVRPETSRGSDEAWAHLPEPVTNNAVAGAEVDGRMIAFSFAGLHAGKTWEDVTADAYACDLEAQTCRQIAGLPDGVGRLASVAATAGGQIYIFGGYTVAEDGSEHSTPEVWNFDPGTERYTRAADMPVPVDDAVALSYSDRYIYLVSGWHETDNVDLVQVYDIEEDRWFEATPWPGSPVFGHAGGIVGNRILICGGAEVVPPASEDARRTFEHANACYAGTIEDGDPSVIAWRAAPGHQGPARYRAAAAGSERRRSVYFIGGTDNPYNYNGIGYDGAPSNPLDSVMYAGAVRDETDWTLEIGYATFGTMDHRGLIEWNGAFFTLGGMNDAQEVISDVRAIRLD